MTSLPLAATGRQEFNSCAQPAQRQPVSASKSRVEPKPSPLPLTAPRVDSSMTRAQCLGEPRRILERGNRKADNTRVARISFKRSGPQRVC